MSFESLSSQQPPQRGERALTFYAVAYFVVLILLARVSIGEEPWTIDLGSSAGSALFALVWFGGGVCLWNLFRVRRDPDAKSFVYIGGIATLIGLLTFALLMNHGWLRIVGGLLAIVICYGLGAMQKRKSFLYGVLCLVFIIAGYFIHSLLQQPSSKPPADQVKKVQKAFEPLEAPASNATPRRSPEPFRPTRPQSPQ